MKTWLNIRNDVLGLGFEKTKAYEKNKQSYIDAYNWSVNLMATTVTGITSVLEIEKTQQKQQVIDLWQAAAEQDKIYSSMARAGITDENGYKLDNVFITDNRYLHLPKRYLGTVKIFYNCMPPQIGVSSPNETLCPLPDKWANILPYLMANRLYLDDDAGKAGYYWNMYEDMKNAILTEENKPVITVVEGFDYDYF